MNAPLKQSRYRVEGMDCASCATKIDTAVRRVEGVQDVSVSVTAGTMTIRHAANSDLANLEKRVTGLGYKVSALAASTPTASVKPPSTKQDHADDDHTGHDHDYAVHATKPHNEEEVVRLHGHDPSQTTGPWWRSSKGMLAIASGVAFVLAYAIGTSFPDIVQWAFIAAMLVGLIPIARRADISLCRMCGIKL